MIHTAAVFGLADRLCPAAPQNPLDSATCTVAEGSFLAAAGVIVLLAAIIALFRRRRAAWTKRSSVPQIVFPMQKGPGPGLSATPLSRPPSGGLGGVDRDVPSSAAADPFAPPDFAHYAKPATESGGPDPEPATESFRPDPEPATESFRPDPEPAAESFRPDPERAAERDAGWPPEPPRTPPVQAVDEPAPTPTPAADRPAEQPREPAMVSAAAPSPAPAAQPAVRAEPAVDGPDREWVDAGPVRFERPPEGTLQLLPGRLEIESGEGRGQEIRFIRAPGSPPEITFGRNTGPAYRHVQLRVPTVSRLHAQLRFQDGRWTIRNLSGTNPTVVNGRTLGSGLEQASLQDGDRIEMGEVVFTFRQPEVRDHLPFRSSWHTDRGPRPTNQDVVVVCTLPGGRELAAVCDGMGSHESGGEASQLAVEALVVACEEGGDLLGGVKRANDAVRSAVNGAPEHEGMGTTLVALLRDGNRYWVANVGDSRAYRIDPSGIRQVTRDHSFVAEATRQGEMSAEEAERSPWRNAVTRNLGATAEVEVDMFGDYSALDPHVVVLCSDGIHRILDPAELERIVTSAPDIRDIARTLCEEAIRREGGDNVAAAAIAFGGGLPRPDTQHT